MSHIAFPSVARLSVASLSLVAMLSVATTASAMTTECDDNGENCIDVYADVEVDASYEDSYGYAYMPPMQDKMQDRWNYQSQDGRVRGQLKILPKVATMKSHNGYLQVPGCTPGDAAPLAERALEDFIAELADHYGFDGAAGIAYMYPNGPKPCTQTFMIEVSFFNE